MLRRFGLAVLLAAVLGGCDNPPSAPPLVQGEPVYHDSREGFRFDTPPGWSMQARGSYPSAASDRERTLVKYKRIRTHEPAKFRVTMIDLPQSTTLASYLAELPPGPEKWKITGPAEDVTVNGVPATRATYSGAEEDEPDEPLTKEIVAFCRGNRAYFFTGIVRTDDEESAGVIRKAVASVVWEEKAGR